MYHHTFEIHLAFFIGFPMKSSERYKPLSYMATTEGFHVEIQPLLSAEL